MTQRVMVIGGAQDALHLEARRDQAIRQILRGAVERDEVAKPGQGKAHAGSVSAGRRATSRSGDRPLGRITPRTG